jgi:hypothetical protein
VRREHRAASLIEERLHLGRWLIHEQPSPSDR